MNQASPSHNHQSTRHQQQSSSSSMTTIAVFLILIAFVGFTISYHYTQQNKMDALVAKLEASNSQLVKRLNRIEEQSATYQANMLKISRDLVDVQDSFGKFQKTVIAQRYADDTTIQTVEAKQNEIQVLFDQHASTLQNLQDNLKRMTQQTEVHEASIQSIDHSLSKVTKSVNDTQGHVIRLNERMVVKNSLTPETKVSKPLTPVSPAPKANPTQTKNVAEIDVVKEAANSMMADVHDIPLTPVNP